MVDPRSSHRRSVLVAVDDGESSQRVVEFVNHFFADLAVEIIGLNVGSPPAPWIPMGSAVGSWFYWPAADPEALTPEEERERRIEAAGAEVESSGLAADEVVARLGDPVRRICSVAVERAVDLIVVGDDHRSSWRHLLDGSVTEEVRHDAPCPVLVVP